MATTAEKFVTSLRAMSKIVNQDYKDGNAWHYTNTKKKYSTFTVARAKNKLTNCVDAVGFGLRDIGVPASALDWYGSKNGLVWCSSNAKKNAAKYFYVKDFNGSKTVNQLVSSGFLQAGDIITYVGMAHTNVFLGNIGGRNKSFDAGAGEGATFKTWVFNLKWGSQKVDTVLRLINREPAETTTTTTTTTTTETPAESDLGYWVQAGAFKTIPEARKAATKLSKAGFAVAWMNDPEYYRICCGKYKYLENAQKKLVQLADKGFAGIIKTL